MKLGTFIVAQPAVSIKTAMSAELEASKSKPALPGDDTVTLGGVLRQSGLGALMFATPALASDFGHFPGFVAGAVGMTALSAVAFQKAGSTEKVMKTVLAGGVFTLCSCLGTLGPAGVAISATGGALLGAYSEYHKS